MSLDVNASFIQIFKINLFKFIELRIQNVTNYSDATGIYACKLSINILNCDCSLLSCIHGGILSYKAQWQKNTRIAWNYKWKSKVRWSVTSYTLKGWTVAFKDLSSCCRCSSLRFNIMMIRFEEMFLSSTLHLILEGCSLVTGWPDYRAERVQWTYMCERTAVWSKRSLTMTSTRTFSGQFPIHKHCMCTQLFSVVNDTCVVSYVQYWKSSLSFNHHEWFGSI